MGGIVTSHSLAKELLSKPDVFITATIGEVEYGIKNIKRTSTHANLDDSSMYITLQLDEYSCGIIRR